MGRQRRIRLVSSRRGCYRRRVLAASRSTGAAAGGRHGPNAVRRWAELEHRRRELTPRFRPFRRNLGSDRRRRPRKWSLTRLWLCRVRRSCGGTGGVARHEWGLPRRPNIAPQPRQRRRRRWAFAPPARAPGARVRAAPGRRTTGRRPQRRRWRPFPRRSRRTTRPGSATGRLRGSRRARPSSRRSGIAARQLAAGGSRAARRRGRAQRGGHRLPWQPRSQPRRMGPRAAGRLRGRQA